MLEQCALAGTAVMVGSDSHIWYDVGEFGYAVSMLKQSAFPSALVVNSDLSRFEAFMGLHGTQERTIAVYCFTINTRPHITLQMICGLVAPLFGSYPNSF